ncbi:MAG: molybdopterin-dependent oxidoreductase [Actinomycetota bacterium]|nr:molybdopterin-dependent oxidoreductase [Actinomycetota bacterium]
MPQKFGTLNNVLQDLIPIVTGNVERAGGVLHGWGIVDFSRFAELGGLASYGKVRSRTTGQPDVVGMLPSTSLVTDITVPGDGQVRALVGVGCNPVLTSGGGGPAMEEALEQLELHVALDLYMNETNKHAHYLLPVQGMFEREDIPLIGLGLMLRPAVWATDAVIDPVGEARSEWWILDDLARRQGAGGAYQVAPMRWLAKLGLRVTPRRMADILLRTSRAGDWFGLRRGGISLRKLLDDEPEGRLVREDLPIQSVRRWLKTKDRRIHVAPSELRSELGRLAADVEDPRFPLRVIGMREVRSQNSWMHNVERLMPDSREHAVLLHPEDAAAAGLVEGDDAEITSASSTIAVHVTITDEMTPGTIAIPHGWGHAGGWQRANRAGGRSSNLLASGANEDLEALAGMSVLNGIPVRLTKV